MTGVVTAVVVTGIDMNIEMNMIDAIIPEVTALFIFVPPVRVLSIL